MDWWTKMDGDSAWMYPVGAVKLFLHCLVYLSISGPASISHAWNYFVVSMWRGVVSILDPWWIHLVIFLFIIIAFAPRTRLHAWINIFFITQFLFWIICLPGSLSSASYKTSYTIMITFFFIYLYRLQFFLLL